MVTDVVCRMSIDPAKAAASEEFLGKRYYFCSSGCHKHFLAGPAAFIAASPDEIAAGDEGSPGAAHGRPGIAVPLVAGILASGVLLALYFGVLALVSGWSFTLQQFAEYWPYIVTLGGGFGIQVGLFAYLRRMARNGASGKVVATTGTTSGAAMVSCCTHYLVNLLPALGATGLLTFVSQYQTQLFWFGIVANLAGIIYIGRNLLQARVANQVYST